MVTLYFLPPNLRLEAEKLLEGLIREETNKNPSLGGQGHETDIKPSF